MCFQGEGLLFDLLAPRGREGASHLVQCFIHSHVIKISWIYSSACLYLETFQHHERWHKQIMELPLCTARRQNRPREKTISLEINCALCIGIHCSVPHKAEGKEMKSHPPLLGCWPGSQGQRGAVPTWEALTAPLELSWWWDGHQALAGTFRDPPASEQAQLRAVTREARPQGPCTNPVPRAGLVSGGGGGGSSHPVLFHPLRTSALEPALSLGLKHGRRRRSWTKDGALLLSVSLTHFDLNPAL